MNHELPVVRCIYTKGEKTLEELIEESFRLYLIRILSTPVKPVVQCLR